MSEEVTHEDLLREIQALAKKVEDLEKSARQFERLKVVGETVVAFLVGIGALTLFVLQVLTYTRGLNSH